jgi:hypothetical protein
MQLLVASELRMKCADISKRCGKLEKPAATDKTFRFD